MYCMFAMYICTMHNRMFIHIASLGRVPSPISLHFINLSCLCSAISAIRQALSRSRVRSSLFPCLVMVSKLFWKYSEYMYMLTPSSKTTIKSEFKSVRMFSQLDHAHSVCTWHTYTYTGRTTYDTNTCIYQRNSAVQLTGVGLAHACPNYMFVILLRVIHISLQVLAY